MIDARTFPVPILSIGSSKGGVGKTYVSTGVSTELAIGARGLAPKRILLVDLDPQGNATSRVTSSNIFNSFLPKENSRHGRWISAFFEQKGVERSHLLQAKQVPGLPADHLYVLPGGLLLQDLERFVGESLHAVECWREIADRVGPLLRDGKHEKLEAIYKDVLGPTRYEDSPILSWFLRSDFVRDHFDLVIIDTPPTKTNLLTQALFACTHYLVVILPTDDAYSGAEIYLQEASRLNEVDPDGRQRDFLGVVANQVAGDKKRQHAAIDHAVLDMLQDPDGGPFHGCFLSPYLPYEEAQLARNAAGLRGIGSSLVSMFRRSVLKRSDLKEKIIDLSAAIHRRLW